MNQKKIGAGDVVKLRSGGPEMSVLHLTNNEEALCMWFEKNLFVYGQSSSKVEPVWGTCRKELIATEALEVVKKNGA